MKMNNDVASLLISINKSVGEECVLPGQWSPKIFYDDIMTAPVVNSEILVAAMKKLTLTNITYLNFFHETRGYEKSLTSYQKELYTLFSKGSLMLYFEEIFLHLLSSSTSFTVQNEGRNEDLLKFLEALAANPISKWNEIVANIGACHYIWFAKEYALYLPLLNRRDQNTYENYTDEELLNCIGAKLEQIGEITISDSRSKLIALVKFRMQSNIVPLPVVINTNLNATSASNR